MYSICMYRCVCVHMYRLDVSISFPSHSLPILYIEAGSLTEPGVPFPISASHILGFIHGHLDFYVDSGDLNSGLHSLTANSLAAELSSKPQLHFFIPTFLAGGGLV